MEIKQSCSFNNLPSIPCILSNNNNLFQVPLKRVHLFTIIQLTCLACLWMIKSFSTTSILFPLMLVVMIGIRKGLDLIFTRRELKILDDIMPEMTKRHELMKDVEVGCCSKVARCILGPKLILDDDRAVRVQCPKLLLEDVDMNGKGGKK